MTSVRVFASLLLLVTSLTLSPATASASVRCRDQEGREVDWWILYKLPRRNTRKLSGHKHRKHGGHRFESNLREGVAYAYLTSAMPDHEWTLSPLPISDPASMPGLTLSQLYSGQEELASVMYNDEKPHGPTSFTGGHTKGVVVGGAGGAVWLIHSVPHYPPYPNETYGYPHTGLLYGQTAMCLSLDASQLESVGKQLTYNQPYIYHAAVPGWAEQYPSLVRAAAGKHVTQPPFYNTEHLATLGGMSVTVFAKWTKFGKDLYADLVAPSLGVPLLVESWPNGPGKMPSRCSGPFIVENVDEMDFVEVEDDDFTTTKDHAKWAISLDRKRPWVCVGDINRMETQRRRGGGTACFSSYKVWKTFKRSVKGIESCRSRNRYG